MATRTVKESRNYAMFTRSAENRDTDPGKRKRLERSMRKYGFLWCFPIVCIRRRGKLVVLEGQHRLAIAETLGIPVYWVEVETEFDIAEINSSGEPWRLKDYAHKWANNGHESYAEGLEFAARHRIPLGIAFALLGGTTTFGNIQGSFVDGSFRIKDKAWADAVAAIYVPLSTLSGDVKNARCLQAAMMVCRVPEFDAARLIQGAHRCRDKLLAYSTRDAYLAMFEEIYNFGRKQLFGLKAAAVMAMRDRMPQMAKTKRNGSGKDAARTLAPSTAGN